MPCPLKDLGEKEKAGLPPSVAGAVESDSRPRGGSVAQEPEASGLNDYQERPGSQTSRFPFPWTSPLMPSASNRLHPSSTE